MMDITIEVNDLRLYACHGVMAQERVVGNDYEVTVHLRYPVPDGCDDIDRTANYAEIVDVVKRVMARPSALLENVAMRLRDELLSRFPLARGGMVRVAKLTPPVPASQMSSAAVKICW